MEPQTGEPNPGESDLAADRPWRHNLKLAQRLPERLPAGQANKEVTRELVRTLRTGSWLDAVESTATQLRLGISTQTISDARKLKHCEL